MSLTDPISNMLASVKNATRVKKETVDVPCSKMAQEVLNIFKEDGYIEDFRVLKDSVQGSIKIYLKYERNKESAIIDLKRISKPGLRVYATSSRIPRVLNGLGTAVLSTSKGIVDGRRARELKVGGEVICYIW
ncbi:MAG: 30S ribosomal protein S8 [Candidatus Aceula meridiana]|nr:30S ribosomal protein S8 [Candidatus Aceula meridiana]